MAIPSRNTIVLRKSAAVIILIIQFVLVATALVAWTDITKLRSFDQRRDYDICLGSNQQIARVVEKLVQPVSVPPNATEIERETARLRNERTQASQQELHKALEENRQECETLRLKQPKGGTS